jgi:hypothetical protein
LDKTTQNGYFEFHYVSTGTGRFAFILVLILVRKVSRDMKSFAVFPSNRQKIRTVERKNQNEYDHRCGSRRKLGHFRSAGAALLPRKTHSGSRYV